VLRIHFSGADLARVRLAAHPDPLWELCLSIHQLRARRGEPTLTEWRQAVCEALRPGPARSDVDVLLRLNPPVGYFPDFLTPGSGQHEFDQAVQAVLRTPTATVVRDVERFTRTSRDRLPVDLPTATGMGVLERALDRYRQIAIDPVWDRVRAAVEADLAQRRQQLAHAGVEGLLASLSPATRWSDGILEITDYRADREVYLDGRGLTLIPGYFKTAGRPIGLADPELPPVLVYSVDRLGGATGKPGALGELIGRTRASVLEAAAQGGTTGEVARRLGISPASASQHLSVLREAGLILSVREGNRVRHIPTTLGRAFLTPDPPRSRQDP
jgi:DNA-binding transcriptional ArsR family regulator